MLPPPSGPADDIQVVYKASLAAALKKLNINIPIEDFSKAIKDEDKARHVKLIAKANQRRAALSKFTLEPKPTAGVEIITTSKFIPNPTEPIYADPVAQEQ